MSLLTIPYRGGRFARLRTVLLVIAVSLPNVQCGDDGSAPPPVPVSLAFHTQPPNAIAGAVMSPAVEVVVRDGEGNTITSSTATVTLSITGGPGVEGAVLGGTMSKAAVGGIATFDDLTVDKAGTGYILTATSDNLAGATSSTFAVVPGAAATLSFTVQPTSMTAGAWISPSVAATIQDHLGNTVTSSTAPVSLAIAEGTGSVGATLTGTVSRPAVAGVATFNDVTISSVGSAYRLTATAPGLTTATSMTFDVSPWTGVPTVIRLQSDPGDYIGMGGAYEYTNGNASLAANASGGRLTFRINGDESWRAEFQSPDTLARLTPGTYEGLRRYPFHDPTVGGLSFSGEGRGCNRLTGWFAIDGVTYRNDLLAAIDIRFEQHCEEGDPALRGTIHWTADDPTVPPGPVNPIPDELWEPNPGSMPAGNVVFLDSDSGDYIGEGQTLTYTPANATISVTTEEARLLIQVGGWSGTFQAMSSLRDLEPGYYGNLQRYPFHNPATGGLDWSGQGRGCNVLSGWFAVDSVTYKDDVLTAIDLRFEQHCERQTPALRGAVRWRQ